MRSKLLAVMLLMPLTCFANEYRYYYTINQKIDVKSTTPAVDNSSTTPKDGSVTTPTEGSTTAPEKDPATTPDEGQAEWVPVEKEPWELDYALYDCTWTPNPSVYTEAKTFDQSADDCSTDYWRHVYPKERNTITGEIRSAGEDYEEDRTDTGQHGVRPYTIQYTAWKDTYIYDGCHNWGPAVDTVNKGAPFTQTATDCQREQERTRQESYVSASYSPSMNHYTTTLAAKTEKRWSPTPFTMTRTGYGTKPFKECKFSIEDSYYALDEDYGTFLWRRFTWKEVGNIYWGSSQKAKTDPADFSKFQTSATFGIFNYYMGASKGNGYYELCRE